MHDYDHTHECIVLVLGSSCTIILTSSCIINNCEWTEAHVQQGSCIRNSGTSSLLSKAQRDGSMHVKICLCMRQD